MEQETIERVLELVQKKNDLKETLRFLCCSDTFLSPRKLVMGATALDHDKNEEFPFKLRLVIREHMEDMKTELIEKLQKEIEDIEKELKEL